MKINFTKKEYRLLLDIAYLGQWMMDAHDSDASNKNIDYDMVVQKINSYAKEMGCEELVEESKDPVGYYTTRKYEDESCVHQVIDKYNEDNFWDELLNRLAERDAHSTAKAEGKEINSAEEFWKYSIPHEKKYAEEFYANGLSRLRITET